MELKLILTGLGGQGVVFLTRLLARTAVSQGHSIIVSETHGMSRRGGAVMSHLKIGGNEAPLIRRGTADILLSLEPSEAVRNLPFLRQGGVAFINGSNGLPSAITERLTQLNIQTLSVPASQIALELGAAAIANVVLAGFAAAHPALPLPIELLQNIIAAPDARGRELNLKALEIGYERGKLIHA